MSKVCRKFDIEERLIDFAVHVIRTAKSLPKKLEIVFPASLFVVGYHQLQIMVKPKTRLRNSTFPVRHSTLNQYVQWLKILSSMMQLFCIAPSRNRFYPPYGKIVQRNQYVGHLLYFLGRIIGLHYIYMHSRSNSRS